MSSDPNESGGAARGVFVASTDLIGRTLGRALVRMRMLRWSRSARRATARRAAALAAVALIGAWVLHVQASAAALRHRWEATVPVLVAGDDLEVGSAIRDADVTGQRWPADLVPPGAITELEDGAVATASIGRGEALVERRIGGQGAAGTAVPPGRSALEVQVAGSAPPLEVGDHVDVFSAAPLEDPLVGLDQDGANRQPTALEVSTDAIVLGVGEHGAGTTLTLAVRGPEVADTAAAVLAAPVAVVLRPRPP